MGGKVRRLAGMACLRFTGGWAVEESSEPGKLEEMVAGDVARPGWSALLGIVYGFEGSGHGPAGEKGSMKTYLLELGGPRRRCARRGVGRRIGEASTRMGVRRQCVR